MPFLLSSVITAAVRYKPRKSRQRVYTRKSLYTDENMGVSGYKTLNTQYCSKQFYKVQHKLFTDCCRDHESLCHFQEFSDKCLIFLTFISPFLAAETKDNCTNVLNRKILVLYHKPFQHSQMPKVCTALTLVLMDFDPCQKPAQLQKVQIKDTAMWPV